MSVGRELVAVICLSVILSGVDGREGNPNVRGRDPFAKLAFFPHDIMKRMAALDPEGPWVPRPHLSCSGHPTCESYPPADAEVPQLAVAMPYTVVCELDDTFRLKKPAPAQHFAIYDVTYAVPSKVLVEDGAEQEAVAADGKIFANANDWMCAFSERRRTQLPRGYHLPEEEFPPVPSDVTITCGYQALDAANHTSDYRQPGGAFHNFIPLEPAVEHKEHIISLYVDVAEHRLMFLAGRLGVEHDIEDKNVVQGVTSGKLYRRTCSMHFESGNAEGYYANPLAPKRPTRPVGKFEMVVIIVCLGVVVCLFLGIRRRRQFGKSE